YQVSAYERRDKQAVSAITAEPSGGRKSNDRAGLERELSDRVQPDDHARIGQRLNQLAAPNYLLAARKTPFYCKSVDGINHTYWSRLRRCVEPNMSVNAGFGRRRSQNQNANQGEADAGPVVTLSQHI